MTEQPTIYITRSPNRPTLAFITFPAGLLHESVTHAHVKIDASKLLVQFQDDGPIPVKNNRLTLPADMAPFFNVGRNPVTWERNGNPYSIILEIAS